jgi:hypothetical protein
MADQRIVGGVTVSVDDRRLSELLSRALRELKADAAAQLGRQTEDHDGSPEALMGVLDQINAALRSLGDVDQ